MLNNAIKKDFFVRTSVSFCAALKIDDIEMVIRFPSYGTDSRYFEFLRDSAITPLGHERKF